MEGTRRLGTLILRKPILGRLFITTGLSVSFYGGGVDGIYFYGGGISNCEMRGASHQMKDGLGMLRLESTLRASCA
jgi:hypothetical protein